jgi:hypothetical protein
MRFLQTCIFVAAAAVSANGAALIATTEDGRKVILQENNTWKFATTTDIIAVKAAQADAAAAGAGGQAAGQKAVGDTTPLRMKSKAQDEPERAGFLDVVGGEKTFDIRKAMWGMDKAEVKKTENLQYIRETAATLEYKFKLIGLESRIIYKFSPDKTGKPRLVGAQYLIDQDDVNPARFFDDYRTLKKYLRDLYGPPISDENNWTNDIYKADENNWGFAISLGFLGCSAIWKTTRTKTVLHLSGSNHILSTNIEYFAQP